jgi:hypothetical protein
LNRKEKRQRKQSIRQHGQQLKQNNRDVVRLESARRASHHNETRESSPS